MKGAPCLGHIAAERLPAVRWATKVELYRMLLRGRAYLSRHFTENASLAGASEAACMSPYHFNRLFRVLFNQTPHEFVIDLRSNHARNLLSATSMPLGAIAIELGFQQASSFSKAFKSWSGVSPRDYRRGQLGDFARLDNKRPAAAQ